VVRNALDLIHQSMPPVLWRIGATPGWSLETCPYVARWRFSQRPAVRDAAIQSARLPISAWRSKPG